MINIEEASKLLSISKSSLRRWEREGKIFSYRTPGGHRRYDENELLKIIKKSDNR
jgi:putative resolvase